MKAGKLPPELLKNRILAKHGVSRPEVVVPAMLGEDSSVLDLGGDLCVVSTDPITGSGNEIGWLAIHVSCNDVASNGAEPVGALLTILVPEGWALDEIEGIMVQADRAAREVGIQIIGGHTEITPNLPHAIVSTTVIGRAPREGMVTSSGLKPGASIIATKGVGVEGTAIFALDFEHQLVEAGVDQVTIQQAGDFANELSVVPEARIATANGATAMHDVTEGGILGALYEFASASEVGLSVNVDAMPIRTETQKICRALGADPLRLIGSGSMLIGAPDSQAAKEIVAALAEADIDASVVAQATEESEGMWMVTAEGKKQLEAPDSDELWRVKERFKQ